MPMKIIIKFIKKYHLLKIYLAKKEAKMAQIQEVKAQELKVKLGAFEDYQGKSTIINPNITDVDVFSFLAPNSSPE